MSFRPIQRTSYYHANLLHYYGIAACEANPKIFGDKISGRLSRCRLSTQPLRLPSVEIAGSESDLRICCRVLKAPRGSASLLPFPNVEMFSARDRNNKAQPEFLSHQSRYRLIGCGLC